MAGDGTTEGVRQPKKHRGPLSSMFEHNLTNSDSLQDATKPCTGILGISSDDDPSLRPHQLSVFHGNGSWNDDGSW